MNCKAHIELGLGLIGIGREWGHVPSIVPHEGVVLKFLNDAYALGIRLFDTAPSYGKSEERLGKFLLCLRQDERNQIAVASKFGDHWDGESQTAFVDHSYDALCASLDNTMKHLGRIDLLQLHKTTPTILKSNDLRRAWAYASDFGIKHFGASISDLESGRMVCDDEFFSVIQLPYNMANQKFEEIVAMAVQRNKRVLVNRPFNMGALLHENATDQAEVRKRDALRFILKHGFRGAILTGTKSIQHLRENWEAFIEAKVGCSGMSK